MFTTVDKVKQATGYDVTSETIYLAQYVIEAYIGRVESEIENPNDIAMISKAVTFQAAYMKDNYDQVYQQIAMRVVGQSDGSGVLDVDMAAPYMAPLAVLALRKLSWRRTRSVKVGPIFEKTGRIAWERD